VYLVGSVFENLACFTGFDVDGEGFGRAVALLICGKRYRNPVILACAKGAALLLADANNGVRRAVDAEVLADGVDAGEEVVLDVGADDGDVGGVLLVGVGEAAALHDVQVLQCGHLSGVAPNAGVGDGLGAAYDFSGGRLLGSNADAALAVVFDVEVVGVEDVFAFLEALVILGAGDDLRHFGDSEDVCAVAGELGGNKGVRAVNEGHDGDDAGDADDDAKQRQYGTQLVRPQGLQRDLYGLFELHCVAFTRYG